MMIGAVNRRQRRPPQPRRGPGYAAGNTEGSSEPRTRERMGPHELNIAHREQRRLTRLGPKMRKSRIHPKARGDSRRAELSGILSASPPTISVAPSCEGHPAVGVLSCLGGATHSDTHAIETSEVHILFVTTPRMYVRVAVSVGRSRSVWDALSVGEWLPRSVSAQLGVR